MSTGALAEPQAVPETRLGIITDRQNPGVAKPRGKLMGFAGVGVRVGPFVLHINPYPTCGYVGRVGG